jgi:hypothetical protein
MNKIIEGAKEALAFARGDCDHEWMREKNLSVAKEAAVCQKCGVRLTTYLRDPEQGTR